MYPKKDQELLSEAYGQIDEGLFNRLKTRGSQAMGAAKGLGKQLKGGAKQALGSVASRGAELGGKALGIDASKGGLAQKGAELTAAGRKDVTQGGRAGNEAKHGAAIKNAASEVINDLEKLGIDVTDSAALEQDLIQVISKHATNVRGSQVRSSSGQLGRSNFGAGPTA